MAVYNTVPRTIEAIQLSADTFRQIIDWVPESLFAGGGDSDLGLHVIIRTPSGPVAATEDSWVVKHGPDDFEVYVHEQFTARYTAPDTEAADPA